MIVRRPGAGRPSTSVVADGVEGGEEWLGE